MLAILDICIALFTLAVVAYDYFGKNLKIKTWGAVSMIMTSLLWASEEDSWFKYVLIFAAVVWLFEGIKYFNKAWPTKDTLH